MNEKCNKAASNAAVENPTESVGEVSEMMMFAKATELNREQKLSDVYSKMYLRERKARLNEERRHQREVNNLLIFFLALAASVAEIIISAFAPAWVAVFPVVLLTLIIRNMR